VKRAGIWTATLSGVAVLLCFAPLAVLSTIAFLSFVLFLAIEFLNVTHLIAKIAHRLAGEPAPDTVDRTLGLMYGAEREYANTRNDRQRRTP